MAHRIGAYSPKHHLQDEGMNCVETGVLGVLPGIIGSFQANEVLKMILGIKGVLSGKLLCYDAKTGSTHQVKITKNDLLINEIKIGRLSKKLPFYVIQIFRNSQLKKP